MLAEIAAANAAFQVIKSAIQNGREIADVAHKVGDYVNATEDLRKKADKRKRKTGSTDLEEFMHLERLKQQEEELKQLMIYTGRPGLWSDWQRFQAEARKARLLAAEQRRRRIKKTIELVTITILCILGGVGIVALIAWAIYLKNL